MKFLHFYFNQNNQKVVHESHWECWCDWYLTNDQFNINRKYAPTEICHIGGVFPSEEGILYICAMLSWWSSQPQEVLPPGWGITLDKSLHSSDVYASPHYILNNISYWYFEIFMLLIHSGHAPVYKHTVTLQSCIYFSLLLYILLQAAVACRTTRPRL